MAVKSGEARRSISGNMSKGVRCKGDSTLEERSELGAKTGFGPEEELILGLIITDEPSSPNDAD